MIRKTINLILLLAIPAICGAEPVVMENETIRMVIDPSHGGSVVSFVHKPFGVDVIPEGRPDQMGLFLDHYWEDGFKWPGELMGAVYTVESQADNSILMRYIMTGSHNGNLQPKLAGLVIEKRLSLKPGVDAVFCHVKISNPTTETKIITYWQQQYFLAGGDYGEKTDVVSRPSTRGVRRIGKVGGNEDDFLSDPWAGWSAVTDIEKNAGLVWVFDYDYLNKTYSANGNLTLEWLYDRALLPAGKSWETYMVMIPILGLPGIAHASENVVAGYTIARDGDTVALKHYLKSGTNRLTDVALDVELEGLVESKKSDVSRISVGDLGSDARMYEQKFSPTPSDPIIIRATITGKTPDGTSFSENYWDFYGGGYGFGTNIQQDLITPLHKEKAPAKNQVVQKPEKIEKRPESTPVYFMMAGLGSDRYNVEQFLKPSTNGKLPIRGDYSVSNFGEGAKLSDFPLDYDLLMRYDAFIAANVKMDCLGLLGSTMFADYLSHGGGLLVLGGRASYSSGGWRGTALEGYLPVTLKTAGTDIAPISGHMEMGEPHEITRGIDLSAAPCSPYLHRAQPKPGSQVVIRMAGEPFMVVWEHNGARVACVLGTPYGDESKTRNPLYFNWTGWPVLMRNTLEWLGRR